MKNLFLLILDFVNAIMWTVLLCMELYQEGTWGFLTILFGLFALLNLITGIVYLVRYRKARAAERPETKKAS